MCGEFPADSRPQVPVAGSLLVAGLWISGEETPEKEKKGSVEKMRDESFSSCQNLQGDTGWAGTAQPRTRGVEDSEDSGAEGHHELGSLQPRGHCAPLLVGSPVQPGGVPRSHTVSSLSACP